MLLGFGPAAAGMRAVWVYRDTYKSELIRALFRPRQVATQRKSCRTFRRLAKKRKKNFTSFFVFQMKIEKEWKEEEEKSARQIYLYTSEERRCFLSRDSLPLLARPLMLSLAPFGPATERKGTRRRAKITPTSSKSKIGRSSNKQTTFRLF